MTTEIYINRKLTLVKGKERTEIEEAELKADRLPLVVLGDAGMGKSRLLQSLAERFSSRRISAGSFVRGANVEAFKPSKGSPIIIDGLDEVAVSHGRSAVDEVLSKLSALDYPPFVLSCRVADWEGAAARHKIAEDYGTDPVVVNLAPFAERDAIAYLNALCLDASAIVADLDKRDLSEFYQNPLTLTLLAKVVRECGGLPTGKADLLDRSARLLLREDNELHKVDPVAKAPEDDLLAAAGAVFAHLLLSGTSGVTTLTPTDAPPGYISTGEVQSLEAGLGAAVVGTRVFRATEEGLFLPFHRVIAEYTAGRWLAAKLDDGISERRLLQLFVVDGGVPTALRGTFAWLGHFAPRLVDDCIRADPYGMLRYGDAEKLPLPQAHLLLRSLNELAEEDPYFRSEDWGRSGIRGIGRVELKDDVLAILRNPERRLHLSTLILEALRGTPLSKALEPELVALLENEAAVFVERSNAGEALAASHSDVDWPGVLTRLVAGNDDSRRLAIELMGELGPNRFDPSFIADMLIGYHRILEEGEHEDEDIVGVDYLLVKRLAATTGAAVLDELAKKISPTFRTRHEELKRRARAVMVRIAVNSLDALDYNQPAPVWRWLRYLSGEFPIHREELDRIAAAITRN
ncbi:MAG: NACHT domain-containing protein, partial [Rhizomicrobium sp.]